MEGGNELLKRGFVTVYHADFELIGEHDFKLGELKFGPPQSPREEVTILFRGLPPPKGTKAWVLLDLDISGFERENSVVVMSPEEVENIGTHFKFWTEEFNNDEEDAIQELKSGIAVMNWAFTSVLLP